MRFAGMCMLVALGAVSQTARADPPKAGTFLGLLEAKLDHCAKVDADNADAYKSIALGLTGNATEKEVAEARKSAEYRAAYAAAIAQVSNLPKEEVNKACAQVLQPAAK